MRKMLSMSLPLLVLAAGFCGCTFNKKEREEKVFQGYVEYFKSVYDVMEKNYYLPVTAQAFEQFVAEFKSKIFGPQVKDKTKIDDAVKHVGTGIMVSKLKSSEDPFTNFFPPQVVKEFKQSVLGYAGDIGIEGYVKDSRFLITQVEPRSDAFKKGIRISDEILKINDNPVADIPADSIKKIFSPEIESKVVLELFSPSTNQVYTASVASSQYFKQSVFLIPTTNAEVSCLKIKFFNEETGNEMRTAIDDLNRSKIRKLILDLRDNSGGPPLAAWDMAGAFLPKDQKLFYFQKRNSEPQGLVSTESPVLYEGTMLVLINKGTGSAAELFAGILQAYNRAGLVGTNSAGQVFLKSLFDLSDGATLELTVAKGYLFNGNPISAEGLKPDIAMADDNQLLASVVSIFTKQ